jgi:hypothetical protein
MLHLHPHHVIIHLIIEDRAHNVPPNKPGDTTMTINNTTTVEFKIAMDADAKKAGDVKTVKFNVSFEGVSDDIIRKAAIANQIVGWQSQLRSHWDEFSKGELPEMVTFGQPLFTSTRRTAVRPPTDAEIQAQAVNMFKGKSPEQIMYFVQHGKFEE